METKIYEADDLLNRYVAAVRRQLPARDAADIAAELREAVLGKIELEEGRLGRPVTRAEAMAVVKSFGSPMLVAARYTGRQHLIGPAVFPYFWPTARVVIGIVAAIALVGSLVPGVLSDEPWRYLGHGFAAAWQGALIAFAIVTAIFMAMERTDAPARLEAAWRPEQLPPDSSMKPKSLFESVFSLAWDVIIIAWWIGLLHLPNQIPGSDSAAPLTISFSASWAAVYWPVLATCVISLAMHVYDIVHPAWGRLRSAMMTASVVVGLYVIWVLANGGRLVDIAGPASASDKVAKLQSVLDFGLGITLYIAAFAFAVTLAIELWRLARSFRLKAPPASLAV